MVCMNEGKAEIDFTCCEEKTLRTLEVNVAFLQQNPTTEGVIASKRSMYDCKVCHER